LEQVVGQIHIPNNEHDLAEDMLLVTIDESFEGELVSGDVIPDELLVGEVCTHRHFTQVRG
jgi:hypothetical protein